jgi:glycosyltransferase involved in cell wall biosynthesis
MNISWYSPFDSETSDIARYSKLLLPAISNLLELNYLSDAVDSFDLDNFVVLDADIASQLIDVNEKINVYHLGNNHVHVGILEKSLSCPGIIVLHDLNLIDLARAYESQSGGLFSLFNAIYDDYGREGLNFARNSKVGTGDYNLFLSQYPVFSSLISNALGVVVHSTKAYEALGQFYAGPVLQLGLPYHSVPLPSVLEVNEDDFYNIIFCGHCGPNRRLQQFITAWGETSEPSSFRLKMFGHIGNKKELITLAKNAGVEEYISINGFVSDEQLNREILCADLAVNLRSPSMGEASGSQLRYMGMGLAAFVTDVAWYSELPDNVVIKVPEDNEVEFIRNELEQMLVSPNHYKQIGANGIEYLKKFHNVDIYVQELVEFIKVSSKKRFISNSIENNIASVIADLCDERSDLLLFGSTAQIIADTFSTE